jgi:hypothetical protein
MLKLRGETKTNVALCLRASFVLPRQQSLCGGFVELEDENLEMKSADNYIWIKAEDEYFFSINSKLYSSSHVKVNLTPKLPNIYDFSR